MPRKPKQETEEEKRTRRIVELASAEVEYLNAAGWSKVMVGPKNEIQFMPPGSPPATFAMRQGSAVEEQKRRDKFSESFPY